MHPSKASHWASFHKSNTVVCLLLTNSTIVMNSGGVLLVSPHSSSAVAHMVVSAVEEEHPGQLYNVLCQPKNVDTSAFKNSRRYSFFCVSPAVACNVSNW